MDIKLITEVLVWLLVAAIALQFFKIIKSRNFCRLWSPIGIISLLYIYYCLIPYFCNTSYYDVNTDLASLYFHAGALISYLAIHIGFHFPTRVYYPKWNALFTNTDCRLLGIVLFAIGLLCYVPFRGFHLTFFNVAEEIEFDRTNLTSYFIDLISLFCAGTCLLFAHRKKRIDLLLWAAIWVSLVFFIIAGFRYRIVMLIVSVFTTYHLFPKIRKPNLFAIGFIAIIAYWGFGVMDSARVYSHGIDLEKVTAQTENNEFQGAIENSSVYTMSALTMQFVAENEEYLHFEPLLTALCMPIPRSWAPWKPDGSYLRHQQICVLGTDEHGAAYLFFTEAFISFGWFGLIFYALFIGWFSKVFWRNYLCNAKSLGAIILLALYNAFCYVLISRGYMAQAFTTFMYYVIIPFWICQLILKVKRRHRHKTPRQYRNT